ncbi:alpha/beta hydrolase [Curtobacterium flaccumfaciens]|uniref:alpha/beta hydrolase n=1 Tax=Curtobacterium flaccumfaciens TaxID=2035 RepID=UPI001BDE5D81|nr:alpha/beta fold hydrolase [Curtobacterium flaccumfaciens]MBT1631512.1 alpha/beta fold hydrolase [Curtobacterium flaccumfaciens pv. oortii]MCX2846820.1 alpha/beta fold hydrolase [Curtobacterium flaccumfaciens pv. oortii]
MGVIGVAAGAATLTVIATATAAGVVVAKKAIHPRPKRAVTVVAVDSTSITVPSDEQTRCPGEYRVYFHDGQHSILVGNVLDDDGRHVRRTILGEPATVPAADDKLVWSGYLLDTPASVSSSFQEVAIAADGDTRKAWYFPVEGATTWAIHVHGIHSGRQAILRAVPDTLSAGMSSLVIGYRGDVEDGRGLPATFGTDEWHDLDAAMRHAVDHGAERLVLVGWSMGATIALHAAARSTLRTRIDAMILVCPALDWFAALRAGAAKAGFPASLGALGALTLTIPGLARFAGLRKAIPRRWMRPTPPAGLPILLVHSSGDRDVPLEVSKRFAAKRGAAATLVEIAPCPHGMELNREPELFHGAIARFLSSTAALSEAA